MASGQTMYNFASKFLTLLIDPFNLALLLAVGGILCWKRRTLAWRLLVTSMFLLLVFGYRNVYETNFGLTHTPDRSKANMWDCMKDWLLHGAVETDDKMAADLAGRRGASSKCPDDRRTPERQAIHTGGIGRVRGPVRRGTV